MTTLPAEHGHADADLSDAKFRDVAVRDCFAQTTGEEHDWLRQPATIGRFDRVLRYLAAELAAQLEAWREGDMRRDAEWAHKVRRLKRAVDTRLAEIGPLAEHHRGINHRTLRALRDAIEQHRTTTIAAGSTVRLADEELWATLDLVSRL